MHIRLASIDDAAAIHQMVTAIAAETRLDHKVTSTPADIAEHGFGPNPEFRVLIAEDNRELAGMCLYFRSFSTWRGSVGGYIQDLFVHPDHRGSGLAAMLLEATAAKIVAEGGTYLRLSVDADNIRGQRFYAKQGMRWSDDERIFQIDGADFVAVANRTAAAAGVDEHAG
ncbi:MAG: GNAT family N-acetyltransferase [Ilumatobacteraceae bacterium]